MISGGGTTLLNFLDRIDAGEMRAEIVGVIASRECSGVDRVRARGLEATVLPRKEYGSVEAYSEALTQAVRVCKPDLVTLAGFLSLWRFPAEYEGRVMNIHPALLPSFGGKGLHGRHVHEAVLAAGCKVSGCTVHFCDLYYDTGPIIVQRAVPVVEGDSPDTLAARVFEQECIAYPEAVSLFAAGRLRIEGRVVRIV